MTSPSAPLPTARRWMPLALLASLAVNLLFLGATGAAVWRFRQAAIFGPGQGPGSGNLLGFTATLPAARKDSIMRQTGEELRVLRPLRAEVRAARHAARVALLADPFDRNAFAMAQARVLDAEFRARKETQNLFLAIAGSMTQEERQAFAHWHPEGTFGSAKGAAKGPGGWWLRQRPAPATPDADRTPR